MTHLILLLFLSFLSFFLLLLLWLVDINLGTNCLMLDTLGHQSMLDTLLSTTNELELLTNSNWLGLFNTLLPVLSLNTVWLGPVELSTEWNSLVACTESTELVFDTHSNFLLELTEVILNPFSTETSLLLSNTELSIDEFDALLNVSLLLTEFDWLMSDTNLLLNDSITNAVTLLHTESSVIDISPSLVVLLGNLSPLLLAFTNLSVRITLGSDSELSTSLLEEIGSLWNLNEFGTNV